MTSLLAHIRTAKEVVRRLAETEAVLVRVQGPDRVRVQKARDNLAEHLAGIIAKMKTA
jgi:hypothetical protein